MKHWYGYRRERKNYRYLNVEITMTLGEQNTCKQPKVSGRNEQTKRAFAHSAVINHIDAATDVYERIAQSPQNQDEVIEAVNPRIHHHARQNHHKTAAAGDQTVSIQFIGKQSQRHLTSKRNAVKQDISRNIIKLIPDIPDQDICRRQINNIMGKTI